MFLLDLFLNFAKIGLFTFGGGYAMIALIEDICVEKKRWITHDEMMNVTVIAESTPGPIAINCATYVGYKQKGLSGAAAATVGMVLPSFCIIFWQVNYLNSVSTRSTFDGNLFPRRDPRNTSRTIAVILRKCLHSRCKCSGRKRSFLSARMKQF